MRTNPWQLFWSLLLILLGTLLLLGNLGMIPFTVDDIFRFGCPAVLILVGIMILLGAAGWPGWTWVPGGSIGDYDVSYSGQEIRDLRLSHGLGDMDVDLRDALFPEGTTRVRISTGLGDVKVRLPKDLPVRLVASTGLGDVQVFDRKEDGFGPRIVWVSPDYEGASRRLELDANSGLGDVTVRAAG